MSSFRIIFYRFLFFIHNNTRLLTYPADRGIELRDLYFHGNRFFKTFECLLCDGMAHRLQKLGGFLHFFLYNGIEVLVVDRSGKFILEGGILKLSIHKNIHLKLITTGALVGIYAMISVELQTLQ